MPLKLTITGCAIGTLPASRRYGPRRMSSQISSFVADARPSSHAIVEPPH